MSRRCHSEDNIHHIVSTIYKIDNDYTCAVEDARAFGELDPRDNEKKIELPNNLLPLELDETKRHQVVKIGANLPIMMRTKLAVFLIGYKDMFTWTHTDMPETHKSWSHRLHDDIQCTREGPP